MSVDKLLVSIFSIIGFIVLMSFGANAQITPPTILPGNMNIVVEKYVQIPDFGGARPLINSIDIQGNRLFASDTEGGYIYEMVENPNGANFAFVFFDVRSAMQATGRTLNLQNNIHGGLQDFAFHPDFATNGKFYTSVMENRPRGNSNGHTYLSDVSNPINADGVLIEWTYNHATGTVDPNSYREVFRVGMPVYDHAIKYIVFNRYAVPGDEDYGLLYVAHGDGSVKSAIAGGGQNNDGLGKIIRINPLQSGTNSYSIPATNPFIGNGQYMDELYAVGFRNPHNISFNKDLAGNVHLISTEPGRDNIEEVNIITAGENYGWSEREGTYVHIKSGGGLINGISPLPANDANFGYTYPAAQWIHTGPVGAGFVGQAISGGHNYTDAANNINHSVFGDFPISGRLFYCDLSDLANQKTKLNFGESPEALTQSQIYEYNLWFDHDNNPNTPALSKTNMLDIIDDEASYSGQRADLRFGNDSQGNLFISSKRNGWVYKVQTVFGSTPPMVDCPTLNLNIGDACNDFNPNTTNDVVGANCQCAGTPIQTFDCPALNANIGDACDDGNANTTNDIVQNNCTCSGTIIPVGNCIAQVHINGRTITVSDMAAPINTVRIINQSWSIIADCTSWEGTDCGNTYSYTVPSDGTYYVQILTYSTWSNQICDVLETLIISGGPTVDCPGLNANIGDACNDGNPNTNNDVVGANCQCAGTPVQTFDCPSLSANIGDNCDDGNANTTGDVVQNDCTCQGTPINIGGCNAAIQINGQTITVNNIAAPISLVKVHDQNWGVLNECSPWTATTCGNTYTYTVPSAGTYFVQVLTFTDWSNQVCDIIETVVISTNPNNCNNVTNGGIIGGDDTICPDTTPGTLINTVLPSGGSGTVEYLWLESTTNCPTSLSQAIQGTNQPSMAPGFLSQTTYYRRLSRRVGCTSDSDWFAGESNCVVVNVEDNGNCGGQQGGCNVAYSVSGNSINVSNLSANIVSVKILDVNWNPIFTCDTWTTPCNNSESITVPNAGDYWVQIQTMTDWSTPVCNIFELVSVGNSQRNSANTLESIEKEKDVAFDFTNKLNGDTEDFKLFPNPAQDLINVALKGFEGKNATLKLIDLFGKELKSVRLENISESTYQLPLEVENGIYAIWILSDDGKPMAKKFLVSKR